MTTYTLFQQSLTGRGVATNDSNAYTLGVQFSVSESVTLMSVWFYSGANAAALPSTTVVFDADTQTQVAGTLDTSPDWSGAAGSGWVQNLNYASGGPLAGISLSSGTNYVVAAFSPGGSAWYSDTGTNSYWETGPGASGITNGPLSAPNSANALHGQAVYNAGGTLTFPISSSAGFDFGVDVGVAIPSGDLPQLDVEYESTDGNGINTYSVTSSINDTGDAGSQPMRVLPPSTPSPKYPHAFLWMLPVEPGQGTMYGDSIGTALSLGAHNEYNLTCIQPGFPIDPWFGDNPDDPATQQETFMLKLVLWAEANLATTGSEKHYLIGFSKSGFGAQALQLRNPGVFEKAASWDFPSVNFTSYSDFDAAPVFGTQPNFASNYELDAGNLAGWAAPFSARNRIWIGGYEAFQADVEGYDTALTTAGIMHTFNYMVNETHAWDSDWVAAALAAMLPPLNYELLMAGFP
jgi:hypothetical protein